jgi:putative membrane protein
VFDIPYLYPVGEDVYIVIKSLHIIFVVTWFSALFYVVRLFIYHTEAQEKEEVERKILQKQYKLMQKRLWYIIGWPSMILTVVFGTWMLVLHDHLLEEKFMHVKLTLVAVLIVYHVFCEGILQKLKKDQIKWKSLTLRLWNEVATVFLVSIVFLIEMGNEINWMWGTLGFVGFFLFLMLIVKLVKKLWKK